MSHITCHQWQHPKAHTLPLIAPPLGTVGELPKTDVFVLGTSSITKISANVNLQKKIKESLKKGFLVLQLTIHSTKNLYSMVFMLLANDTNTQTHPRTTRLIDWIGLGVDLVNIPIFFTCTKYLYQQQKIIELVYPALCTLLHISPVLTTCFALLCS